MDTSDESKSNKSDESESPFLTFEFVKWNNENCKTIAEVFKNDKSVSCLLYSRIGLKMHFLFCVKDSNNEC